VIDSDGRVWLIEVNSAPACAQRLTRLIAADLVATVIDSEFPLHSSSLSLESLRLCEGSSRAEGSGGFRPIS